MNKLLPNKAAILIFRHFFNQMAAVFISFTQMGSVFHIWRELVPLSPL